MIIQIQTKKFLTGLQAKTPDTLRDIIVAVSNLNDGVAWEVAAEVRSKYPFGKGLQIDTEFVTLTLPDWVLTE